MSGGEPSRWQRLEDVFHRASELPPAERDAFLARECAGDAALRDEVAAMLEGDVEDDFLVGPDLGPPSSPVTGGELGPGRTVGNYRILRVLASGGMGTVYEAEQQHPERRVALKVMRSGLFSPSAVRRFEYESEVLGRLRHPGVAQVFEAGTCDDGGLTLPWFAMELIEDARPITDHAARERLDTEARVALLADVCDAVHHGHRKGVIHRDIKPDNVLVDGAGRPKIIDFGVARHADADAQLTTMRTAVGEIVGTLGYMSPEQCSGVSDDIDTRSDVYGLGVLLYELLSGELPYDLAGRNLPDAVRIISDAAPRRLPDRVSGDVEAITLKALEKNPQRRYQSAAELAEDLRRSLRSEPVAARPPSLTYHLRLFARRHRALMASAAAIFVVLAGATVVSTVFAVESSARALEAEKARDAMDVERKSADEMLSFLTGLLAKGNPTSNAEVTVREMLEKAVPRVETEFADRPQIQSKLLITVADGLRGLGRFQESRERAQQALDILRGLQSDTRFDRCKAYSLLGVGQMLMREFDAAEVSLREALALSRELFGENHRRTATIYARLGSLRTLSDRVVEAEEFLQKAIRIRRSLADAGKDSEVAQSLANLGSAFYFGMRKLDKAAEYMEHALREFERVGWQQSVLYAQTLANHGQAMQVLRRFPESEQSLTAALAIFRARQGENGEGVASTHEKLGFLHLARKDMPAATRALQKTLAIRRVVHGERSESAANTLTFLGYVHINAGQFAAALAPLREALSIQEKKLDAKDMRLAGTLVLIGRALLRTDKAQEALPFLDRCVTIRERLGPGHPRRAAARSAWAACRSVLGEHAAAEPILLASHAALEKAIGPKGGETVAARRRLAEHFARCGKPGEASKWK